MRLLSSIFIVLLQCATAPSFAAKGHTTNNGGNLAEIRFTDAWANFAKAMAPCLTKANLCGLSEAQKRRLQSAVTNKANMPMVMPAEELLYHADGSAKSEAEMYEVVLSITQDCGGALSTVAMEGIVPRALEFENFFSVTLFNGQTWHVFQRNGIFVEDVRAVHDLTPSVRQTLRLPADAPIKFERVWVRRVDGLVEFGGRITYVKAVTKNNGFTFTINPFADGTIPGDVGLVIFR